MAEESLVDLSTLPKPVTILYELAEGKVAGSVPSNTAVMHALAYAGIHVPARYIKGWSHVGLPVYEEQRIESIKVLHPTDNGYVVEIALAGSNLTTLCCNTPVHIELPHLDSDSEPFCMRMGKARTSLTAQEKLEGIIALELSLTLFNNGVSTEGRIW
ncbi:hypothetical protein J4464_01610 [Candidatus Woesearchaeota archaeon]|nr:hypothetical protein [uncultured archaeon]MBS3142063.1 hypothetical protein [Candidatus Woesearchaeota archaeon]